jgi:hypothetical protein
MAIVQKVIVLNKPFKIFGFSFIQWILILAVVFIGLWVGAMMPQVKINGVQLSIWVTLFFFCLAPAVNVFSIKPWPWWRNRLLSISNLLPTEILPKSQPAKIYFEEDTPQDKQL